MIRALQPEDIEKLQEIHEKFYKHEFEFPNFYNNFLCAFAVINDNEIISAGGIRLIPEAVIITDKDKSARARRSALYEILQASSYITERAGYGQICAEIINDPKWKLHLTKVGFKPTKGELLVLSL